MKVVFAQCWAEMFITGRSSLQSRQICQEYTSSCTEATMLFIAVVALLHLRRASVTGRVHRNWNMSYIVLQGKTHAVLSI